MGCCPVEKLFTKLFQRIRGPVHMQMRKEMKREREAKLWRSLVSSVIWCISNLANNLNSNGYIGYIFFPGRRNQLHESCQLLSCFRALDRENKIARRGWRSLIPRYNHREYENIMYQYSVYADNFVWAQRFSQMYL